MSKKNSKKNKNPKKNPINTSEKNSDALSEKSSPAPSVKKSDDVKKKQSGKPSLPLLAVLALLLVITVNALINKGGDNNIDGPEDEALNEADFKIISKDQALENLGKTLFVGSSNNSYFETLKAKGTTKVFPKDIEGAVNALQSDNVEAFEALLIKNSIKAVVVNPQIVERNPIPHKSVKNRLALANPSDDLGAEFMCSDFFVYKFGHKAPQLTVKDKKDLIAIVRKSAGASVKKTRQLSPLLTKQGNWRIILTVRPYNSRHLSYHTIESDTLEHGAKSLASRVEKYFNKKGFDKKYGPLKTALNDKISLEFEICYDRGLYAGSRERLFMWRIFEPGIYGQEARLGEKSFIQPPWYSVTENLRTLSGLMGHLMEKTGYGSHDAWLDSDTPLWRFRTVHFRQKNREGDVEDLYRSLVNVTKPGDINKQSLLKSLKGFGDWLSNNSKHYTDHRMIYRYFPVKDSENNEYNMVRHALGAYSMALVQEMVPPDPKYRETAENCLQWIEAKLRWGGPPRKKDGTLDNSVQTWQGKQLPGSDVAIIEADENMYDPSKPPAWSNKMGMVSMAILGYTQFQKAGWELSPERQKILKGLANFLLYMQKEDGTFHHYYVATQNSYYNQQNSIYPGEILYALARLYGETGDERYKIAFKQSMNTNLAWFKREMEQKEPDGTYEENRRKELVQFQPWIAMGMEEMYRHDKDPAYVEASNLVSLWVMDTYQFNEKRAFYPDYLGGYMKVLDELPAMHTFVYTEGTAASYMLARSAKEPMTIVNRLRKGALLSARFILQQQIRKGENDYYYPNPDRAAGGIKYCMNHNKQRIDYNYHALSSIYRIINAATDDDYKYIQSFKLPKQY